jgi:hypothetical protein
VERDVVTCAEPAEVAADERLPRVGQRRGGHRQVTRDVVGQVDDVHGHPAHVHDVDHHQRVVLGKVDDAVVGRVVGAVPGELDPLPADLQGAAIGEGLLRRRPVRVVVPEQEAPRLLVPNPHDVLAEERGRAGMVGVVVGVDQVGHLVAHAVRLRDLVDGPLQVVPDARRRVEEDDAVRRRQERGLVDAVRDPIEVPLDAPDVVPLLVGDRTEGRRWDRGIVGKDACRSRLCTHSTLLRLDREAGNRSCRPHATVRIPDVLSPRPE